MTERILITGAAGFFGHHFCEHLIKETDWDIVALDCLTYASRGWERLRDVHVYDDKRVLCLSADFTKPFSEGVRQEVGDVDYIVHAGAETHVDNSIVDARPFVEANVKGTLEVLEYARTQKDLKQFIYFSTDEVFGPAPDGVAYREWDRYDSTNPYAATKAGGEELALSYANTHKIPVAVTHTMNLIGERQHSEKYIPKVVKAVCSGETITVHADPTRTQPGTRHYIHCRNAADGILFLLQGEQIMRDKFNIVGEKEVDNLQLAQFIADVIGKPLHAELVDFHSSRPGHDLAYRLDGSKMAELGWSPPKTFESSLKKTIEWMLHPENRRWLEWN